MEDWVAEASSVPEVFASVTSLWGTVFLIIIFFLLLLPDVSIAQKDQGAAGVPYFVWKTGIMYTTVV